MTGDEGAVVWLFVCSGNTCRSPMASAILRHFASQRRAEAVRVEADSAGTGAFDGLSATDGAIDALKKFDIDLGDHASQRLTVDLIRKADRIFCMTPSHVAGVLALDPGAAGKTLTLDPARGVVNDPFGGAQDVYDETCRRLADLIALRLKELDEQKELDQ